jgi:hypothetical protein
MRRSVTLFAAISGLMLLVLPASAAELIMFEQAGCPWCAAFNREIAPVYPMTWEGKRVSLRRVDINGPVPNDLSFILVERVTPVFVLTNAGQEIGRIRGYPGEDHFWGLLDGLIARLNRIGNDNIHAGYEGKPVGTAISSSRN